MNRTLLVLSINVGLWSCWGCGSSERSPLPNPQSRESAASVRALSPRQAEETISAPANSSQVAREDAGGESTLAAIPGLDDARLTPRYADEMAFVDPSVDGWSTEVFTEQALVQLRSLGNALEQSSATNHDESSPFLTASFATTPWRSRNAVKVYADLHFEVWRASAEEKPSALPLSRRGWNGIRACWEELFPAAKEIPHLHPHFKIVHVEPRDEEQGIETEVHVDISGSNAEQRFQYTADWLCEWQVAADAKQPPRLRSIRLLDFEEVVAPHANRPLFADKTAAVLAEATEAQRQLASGIDVWREQLDWRFHIDIVGYHGLAIGDVNQDGRDDVYLCEPGGLPNRLLVQQADGTTRDMSAEAGVNWLEPTHSALFLDLDNDGDQDLIASVGRFVLVHENLGHTGSQPAPKFVRRETISVSSWIRSMAAADYDDDGDLDIYLCCYFNRDGPPDNTGLGNPVPYFDANNGGENVLLRQDVAFQFTNATQETGLGEHNTRFSFAAAWEDYDNDGDVDLYVANDFGRNCLYRNDEGTFHDVAAEAGVEDISNGMSVSWGDFNRDGWSDIYVSNMFSSAGNRISYQRRFKPDADDTALSHIRRHARGNTLFENAGDGTFHDVSLESAVTLGRWAWGSLFADINNDGWEDVLVANGMVTSRTDTGDL